MSTAVMSYQDERPTRPRTKSMLSFNSNKSAGSGPKSPKSPKMDLTETSKEKAHRRINSKNDPNMAMKELQPGQAAFEKSTLDSLRGIQHKDQYGNPITDPDKSNPTRPRLERPLDTIRSFEAAIDGSYGKRHSTIRPDTAVPRDGFQSRRSSYHQGYSNGPQPRFQPDGGYGNNHGGGQRMAPPRQDAYNDGYNRASPAPYRDQRRMSNVRNHSDPALYGNNSNTNGYSANHNYHQSYDTATSASGSGGSHGNDQWGNSTDPSSENSSMDRIPQPPPKPDLAEQYGFSGFGTGPNFRGPIIEEVNHGAPGYGEPGYGRANEAAPPNYNPNGDYNGYPGQMGGAGYDDGDMPPPPPPHKNGAVPQKNGGGRLQRKPTREAVSPPATDSSEKRKSWLKRRFSRN